MTLVGIIIAGLIAVNAFYVLAEFAAVSVRQTQLRPLADRGHRLAAHLLPIVADPRRLDQYIAACQIGITLSSLVLGAYGQLALASAAAPALESWGLGAAAASSAAAVTVLLALTGLQVVMGELVPKSLALQFPLRAGLYTYWPMHLSVALVSGFIRVLNGTGLALLRALRVPEASHRHIHSPEEIDLLIAESVQRGVLESSDQHRLVGEIAEGLPAAPPVWTDVGGRVHAAGTARLDEVGERFGLALEHPDVDTVSGLVLALLDRPPRSGDVVVHGGLRFEVGELAGRGVSECVITRARAEDQGR